MKARLISYDYSLNQATFQFETDFSEVYEKYKDKDINIEIKVWRLKRSLAANRYMWVLIDKLAAELGMTKNEVYRKEVREIGGAADVLSMPGEAVERFCRSWELNGIGWQAELIQTNDEVSLVMAYYGSSTFDRSQMSQLIENLIFEAEQLGIDTETPDKQIGRAHV